MNGWGRPDSASYLFFMTEDMVGVGWWLIADGWLLADGSWVLVDGLKLIGEK